MKIFVFLCLLFLAISKPAGAYFDMRKEAVNSEVALSEAKKLRLTISNHESNEINDLKSWRPKKKQYHLDSAAPEPLLLTAEGDQKKIETAKIIGKVQLFNAIKKNWKIISQTPINEYAFGEDEWEKFEPYLRRKLSTLEYVKTKDPNSYLFMFSDGSVRVNADFKSATRTIETAHVDDGNELEEGVNKLVIPDTPKIKAPPHDANT